MPQAGRTTGRTASCPPCSRAPPFNADKPIPHLAAPAGDHAGRRRRDARLPEAAQRASTWTQHPGDTRARRAHRQLRAGRQDAALRAAEVADLSHGVRRHDPRRTAPTTRTRSKAGFARNCLLARRLLERGVRFVQLFNGAYAMGEGVGNWDGHKTLKEQYDIHGADPRPARAPRCSRDLKQRGLLDDTLVVWVTEFGRMPTFQKGASGRDHNPKGFTSGWPAPA